MKKILFFAASCSLCLPIQGQETEPAPEETIQEMEQVPAALASTRAANSSEWQNWVFAGTAAVAFTIGVLIISLNPGSTQSAGH
jgi:hypothetical protein